MATALRRAGAEHVRALDRGRLGARAGPEARVSFASPAFLAALALVPLVLVAQIAARRRARRYAVRFPGVATLAPLLPRASAWRRRVPLALFLAALAALSLALARPHATVAVPREQASIVLVTDVSRSMLADDVRPEPPRGRPRGGLALPRRGAGRGARGRGGVLDRPAHASSRRPRTTTRSRNLIDSLSADGGTATGRRAGGGAGDGRRAPREERPPAAIVLLSDGETTTGRDPIRGRARGQAPGHPDPHGRAGHPRRDDHHTERHHGAGPARPGDDAEIAELSGGRGVPGRGRRRARRASTRASARAWRPRRRSAR